MLTCLFACVQLGFSTLYLILSVSHSLPSASVQRSVLPQLALTESLQGDFLKYSRCEMSHQHIQTYIFGNQSIILVDPQDTDSSKFNFWASGSRCEENPTYHNSQCIPGSSGQQTTEQLSVQGQLRLPQPRVLPRTHNNTQANCSYKKIGELVTFLLVIKCLTKAT